MTILFGVTGAFAVTAWIVAVIQAIQIVRLAPKGEKLASYFALGWWKFRQIEAKAGPASVPHLVIYQRAVVAFIVFVVLGLVLSGWAISQTPAPAASAQTAPITDWRVIPAQYADIVDIRRVATMPGVFFVES